MAIRREELSSDRQLQESNQQAHRVVRPSQGAFDYGAVQERRPARQSAVPETAVTAMPVSQGIAVESDNYGRIIISLQARRKGE